MSPGCPGGRTSTRPPDRGRRGAAPAADHPQRHGVGGDLAASPDGAAVRPGHARCEDRRGHLHQRGPGRPPATRTVRPRRLVSSTSTRSPTARSYPRRASPKSPSAWASSARSTSSPTPGGSGPSKLYGHIKQRKRAVPVPQKPRSDLRQTRSDLVQVQQRRFRRPPSKGADERHAQPRRPETTHTKKAPAGSRLRRPFALSGRQDLNLRPLDPQSSALPSCATSRCPSDLGFPLVERAWKQYRTRVGDRARLYRGPASGRLVRRRLT